MGGGPPWSCEGGRRGEEGMGAVGAGEGSLASVGAAGEAAGLGEGCAAVGALVQPLVNVDPLVAPPPGWPRQRPSCSWGGGTVWPRSVPAGGGAGRGAC